MPFLQAGGARLEYRSSGPRPSAAPTLVFLHEGLGCVGMWRDFPDLAGEATGCGVFVYSRPGYGASDPVPLPRPVTYMHDDAAALPEILRRAGIERHILVGHSDGGSIALIHGGSTADANLLGIVTLAAHVFCEDVSVASIAEAKRAYETTDLRARLARHHGANVDCAFWGWNRAWLDPAFHHWNIEAYLPKLRVPVLSIQGAKDEYGTLAQLEAILRQAGAGADILVIPRCGHSPHKDQPEATLAALAEFVTRRKS